MSRKSKILVTIGTELSQIEGEPVLLAKEKMEFLIFTWLNEGVLTHGQGREVLAGGTQVC